MERVMQKKTPMRIVEMTRRKKTGAPAPDPDPIAQQLDRIRRDVMRLHGRYCRSLGRNLADGIAIGLLLREAKTLIPHGHRQTSGAGYLRWLGKIGLARRTAQRYVEMASAPEQMRHD